MPKPSIVPVILAVLEPWLDDRVAEWRAQPMGQRAPTLPVIHGKVDVRGVTTALGLKRNQEQHFFNKPDLASAVNAVALEQSLKPIRSRVLDDAVEKPVADRLTRTQRDNGDMARALAESAAVVERQRRRIDELQAQLGLLEDHGMMLRTNSVR